MIKESYDQALQMLRENRELMDKLAAFLIERETITGKEFMEIFRQREGTARSRGREKECLRTRDKKTVTDPQSTDAL